MPFMLRDLGVQIQQLQTDGRLSLGCMAGRRTLFEAQTPASSCSRFSTRRIRQVSNRLMPFIALPWYIVQRYDVIFLLMIFHGARLHFLISPRLDILMLFH